ncbi:MAG: flavodoxin family protein [Candidatus Bipolaricaulota bacterium]
MKAVVLDGSRDERDSALLAHLVDSLARADHAVEVIALREKKIAPCLGCFGCWVKTPGECVLADDGRDVARALARSDLMAYFTPVTFGGVSAELKKALDRMIPNISPFFARVAGETHHRRRYPRPPALLGLGTLDAPDLPAEALFKTLVERNALNLRTSRMAASVVTRGDPRAAEAISALVKAVTS